MVLRKKAKGKAKGVEQDVINVENTQMQDALDEFANRNECEEKQDRDFGGLALIKPIGMNASMLNRTVRGA